MYAFSLYHQNISLLDRVLMLQSSCKDYIQYHPKVINNDVFEELPECLQAEVEGLVSWPRPRPPTSLPPTSGASGAHSSSLSSSASSVDDLIRALDIEDRRHARHRVSEEGGMLSMFLGLMN